ncbi:MAG: hypothetical protein ACO3SP_03725 [Ilumatobacteraceae bacterium]
MSRTAKRPFWLHQAAEYVIGLAAVASGFQSPDPVVPAVMGALILINAAVADGALGAFRVVSRRWHRRADIAVLIALVLLIVVADVDLSTRLVQIGIIMVLGVVVMGTDYRNRDEIVKPVGGPVGRSADIGRRAGHVAGSLAARLRDSARRRS